eukprot:COSAG01_NODE_10861_length_2066_cov_1.726487_3_plen_268_part_01
MLHTYAAAAAATTTVAATTATDSEPAQRAVAHTAAGAKRARHDAATVAAAAATVKHAPPAVHCIRNGDDRLEDGEIVDHSRSLISNSGAKPTETGATGEPSQPTAPSSGDTAPDSKLLESEDPRHDDKKQSEHMITRDERSSRSEMSAQRSQQQQPRQRQEMSAKIRSCDAMMEAKRVTAAASSDQGASTVDDVAQREGRQNGEIDKLEKEGDEEAAAAEEKEGYAKGGGGDLASQGMQRIDAAHMEVKVEKEEEIREETLPPSQESE